MIPVELFLVLERRLDAFENIGFINSGNEYNTGTFLISDAAHGIYLDVSYELNLSRRSISALALSMGGQLFKFKSAEFARDALHYQAALAAAQEGGSNTVLNAPDIISCDEGDVYCFDVISPFIEFFSVGGMMDDSDGTKTHSILVGAGGQSIQVNWQTELNVAVNDIHDVSGHVIFESMEVEP